VSVVICRFAGFVSVCNLHIPFSVHRLAMCISMNFPCRRANAVMTALPRSPDQCRIHIDEVDGLRNLEPVRSTCASHLTARLETTLAG